MNIFKSLLSFLCAISILFSSAFQADGQNTAAQAREKVLEYNSQEKFLNFSFITDVHIDGKTNDIRCAKNNLEHFVSVCNEGYCDFAAFGGDAYSAYNATRSEAYSYASQALEYFNRIRIPFYATKGNHDRNAKINQEETITNTQYHLMFHNRLDRNLVRFNPDDPYGNYFYVDYPVEKVRIIVLNYFDSQQMQKAGIHDRQLEWLAGRALDFQDCGNPCEWTVVFFAHHYKQCGEGFWKTVEQRQTLTGFSTAAFIYGDTHQDQSCVEHGMNMVGVICGYCKPEECGTPSEDSFSIFTIDTKNRRLIETRIGRGKDRIFPF